MSGCGVERSPDHLCLVEYGDTGIGDERFCSLKGFEFTLPISEDALDLELVFLLYGARRKRGRTVERDLLSLRRSPAVLDRDGSPPDNRAGFPWSPDALGDDFRFRMEVESSSIIKCSMVPKDGSMDGGTDQIRGKEVVTPRVHRAAVLSEDVASVLLEYVLRQRSQPAEEADELDLPTIAELEECLPVRLLVRVFARPRIADADAPVW